MTVELRVLRYDPERDAKPHEERYTVEAGPMDRVLDLLHKVKYEQDGTLTFRRSCAHGVCGSDAMLINGRNRLACKIRVDQLGGKKITVAPLPGLPVMKDLVVARPEYVGPAAIVNAHRFIFDSRDDAADERLEILADKDGVWRCRTIFNCVDACPRDIHITQAILEVSSAITGRRV